MRSTKSKRITSRIMPITIAIAIFLPNVEVFAEENTQIQAFTFNNSVKNVLYTGTVDEYDNGILSDFYDTETDFAIMYEWNDEEDKPPIYIRRIPRLDNIFKKDNEAEKKTLADKKIFNTDDELLKNFEELLPSPEFDESKIIPLNSVQDYRDNPIPNKIQSSGSSEEYRQLSKSLSREGTRSQNFVYNQNLLNKINTITVPQSTNGVKEPKFAMDSFIDENISDYSGNLTLNFEDLVLEGKNGLDLRIGRTYQSAASGIGEKSLMVLPNDNGDIGYWLVNKHSSYLMDRYNLGTGWGFAFPSVQVETEYIPEEVGNSYYYVEQTELYYHSGNGNVYQVDFTADTSDSNLKNYYKKDIQFNRDTGYTNGQVQSVYSLTLADRTKQYFASDGRLIGIVDRFGNEIKFEHTMRNITNLVPDPGFEYDDGMWISSQTSDNHENAVIDVIDNVNEHYMHFLTVNSIGDTYILSRPIQVIPNTDYTFSMDVLGNGSDIDIEIIGYDTAYQYRKKRERTANTLVANTWSTYDCTFSMPSDVRYVVIKLNVYSPNTYIDNVCVEKSKPLISRITDSIGRTVDFSYTGDMYKDSTGSVSLLVTAPDNSTKTLTYNKNSVEFVTDFLGHDEQRFLWYLISSDTEGVDGALTYYEYNGGIEYDLTGQPVTDNQGNPLYIPLYINYESKTHSTTDSWVNTPLLNSVRYKDRKKMYRYEAVRKHFGDDGYFDTLRISKRYDMRGYAYNNQLQFEGELNALNYSYDGTYNNNSFNNETGYPNYEFDDESMLNELWTTTKNGKAVETTTFSNAIPIQRTQSSNGTTVLEEYTNDLIFKDQPTQIKSTISQSGQSRDSYVLYTYNDWGGVASKTKEVETSIKNNSELLAKYTTQYTYNPSYHFVTEKSYYINTDKPEVAERNTYDNLGRLAVRENAVNEKTKYFYDSTNLGNVIRIEQPDPMGFTKVLGDDSVITYSYDAYGLYPVSVTENYGSDTATNSFSYDYITGKRLSETYPDGGFKLYTYYSDGKIATEQTPYVCYIGGNAIYTEITHTYYPNVYLEGYDSENHVATIDIIRKYAFQQGSSTGQLYAVEQKLYDAAGNLIINIHVSNNSGDIVTKYYYDNYDRLIRIVDADTNSTEYIYDGFDRPQSITDSEENVYNYSYNDFLNETDITLNTAKHLMTQKYDLYGNVTRVTAYPNNDSTQITEEYEYDLIGNVINYTDPKGNETEYLYDAKGRMKEAIFPNGQSATSNYSVFDKPSFEKVFDDNGEIVLSIVSYRNEKGDIEMKLYHYNNKLMDSYQYQADDKGRIVLKEEGETSKSYIYDHSDNVIQELSGNEYIARRYSMLGELRSASSNIDISSRQYIYDNRGNVVSWIQGNSSTSQYAYSPTDKITGSLTASGRVELYSYTPNGNLETVTTENGTIELEYEYYENGTVESITYPNGIVTEYTYDNLNRIIGMTTTKGNTTVSTLAYTYDANGNILTECTNGQTTAYTYDSLDRLITVTYPDLSTVTYQYDALNNRTKETYSGGTVKDYEYNDRYQLIQIKTDGVVTDTFTYNESGAVTAHNDDSFSYNEWDRLTEYSDSTDDVAFTYDTNGLRTGKGSRGFIVDPFDNVVAETDANGTITAEIMWANNKPVARKTSGNWYYYLYNAHGDVIALTDSAGNVVNSYTYDVWGNIKTQTETVENPIKYAGEYYDNETGLYYLRARYYDPQTGRFISYDNEEGSISNFLDMNRYVYCRNNPVKYVDPSGNFTATAAVVVTAPEWVPYVVAGAAAVVGAGIMYYKEHSSNKRKSNLNRHQEGQARKLRDAGGEKGDARRTPRKDKRK